MINNDLLRQEYKDFLLVYFAAEYPMRNKWNTEAKLDYMLDISWFTSFAHYWLEMNAPEHNWNSLETLAMVIRHAVWTKTHAHPFVQECIRLHRELFEGLIKDE